MKDKTILTPQQQLFMSFYIDPTSESFSNAFRSAVRAGYSEEYALNITNLMPNWLSDFIGKDNTMLMKAERNLDRFLDETRDKRVALDATKFVAERLGKQKYSQRSELTGRDGKDLPAPILGGLMKENVPEDNSS